MTLRHFFTLVLLIVGIATLQWLTVPPPRAEKAATIRFG